MKKITLALVCIAAITVYSTKFFAQTVPDPVLTITETSPGEFDIKITNGVSFANYLLYRRQLLEPAYPWTEPVIGTLGQTNFSMSAGIETINFYIAAVGTNWDGDASVNWRDAQPSNPSVGELSITIDNPLNGTTLQ